MSRTAPPPNMYSFCHRPCINVYQAFFSRLYADSFRPHTHQCKAVAQPIPVSPSIAAQCPKNFDLVKTLVGIPRLKSGRRNRVFMSELEFSMFVTVPHSCEAISNESKPVLPSQSTQALGLSPYIDLESW